MKVDDEFIDEVVKVLGSECGTWDVVDPKEICEAVIEVYENRILDVSCFDEAGL